MAEAEVTDVFPVITVVEEAIDKGLMTGIDEDILLLDPNPEDIILHKVPIISKTITTIGITIGSRDLEVPLDFLPGDPNLLQYHPVEMETDVLAADNLAILLKYILRRTLQ